MPTTTHLCRYYRNNAGICHLILHCLVFFNKGDGSSKSKKLKKDKKHKKHKHKEKGEILKSYQMPFIYLSTMKCIEI